MTDLRHMERSLTENEIYFYTSRNHHNNLLSNVIMDILYINSNLGHNSMLVYSTSLCAKHHMGQSWISILSANSREVEISLLVLVKEKMC